jgi:hypothetical protein
VVFVIKVDFSPYIILLKITNLPTMTDDPFLLELVDRFITQFTQGGASAFVL